jgi:hypothetical protein
MRAGFKEWTLFTCSVCRREDTRGRIIFDATGSREYCKHCLPKLFRESTAMAAHNPFADMTLDHVRDERGQKVKVNSLSELRAAEKKFNFALAVASDDGGSASRPPQHEPGAGDIARNYKKKWARDPAAYRPENVKGVSAGVVEKAADTLVERPISTRRVGK